MIDLLEKTKTPQCGGVYFRVSINDYKTDNEYVYSTRVRLLKRRSCLGCASCLALLDEYSMAGEMPILPKGIKDRDIVELKVLNISRDYETGYVDGWDLSFVKVNENETT